LRTLAIDYGSKRMGLALSDEGGTIATPLRVLEVTSPAAAVGRIAQIAREQEVRRLVVGVPLNMEGVGDDSIGPAARSVIAWAGSLAADVGVELILVDERLSSFQAEQQLIDRKRGGEHLTRRGKQKRLDALVAANLLQAFLDGKLPALRIRRD
jgi:putative Holliday junction resolvase